MGDIDNYMAQIEAEVAPHMAEPMLSEYLSYIRERIENPDLIKPPTAEEIASAMDIILK